MTEKEIAHKLYLKLKSGAMDPTKIAFEIQKMSKNGVPLTTEERLHIVELIRTEYEDQSRSDPTLEYFKIRDRSYAPKLEAVDAFLQTTDILAALIKQADSQSQLTQKKDAESNDNQ